MGLESTRDRFGYQWTRFDHEDERFEEHLLRLLKPLDRDSFRGKLVLDAGCGYGRYSACMARFGARVVGMDFSDAVAAAARRAAEDGFLLVRGDILRPPFGRRFDLVVSIGVIHHLPDPFEAFERLVACARPAGTVVVWVYSSTRRLQNRVLGALRRAAGWMPNPLLQLVTFILAVPDFLIAKAAGLVGRLLGARAYERLVPSHFRLYSEFSFRVCWADWFDRLGAPIRHYHDASELRGWLERLALEGEVEATEDYGWTVAATTPEA